MSNLTETTVVTAYYPLSISKHSVANYRSWIQNFCKIPCTMIIFTTEELALEIYQWRKPHVEKTKVFVRPFDSYAMTCPSMMDFWRKQWQIDPEKHIHSPELYAVWALKQEWVRIVVNKNPFQSRWFVWCDMGIQRFHVLDSYYESFPSEVGRLCEAGRMAFLEVDKIPDQYILDWVEKKPMVWPVPAVTLGGGCIAGDAETWEEFGQAYKDMLKEFAIRGWFAGKDQIVFFTILMERKMKKPFRLFHAGKFSTEGVHQRIPGLEWMCFPVMLGGSMPAPLDMRFEEEPERKELVI